MNCTWICLMGLKIKRWRKLVAKLTMPLQGDLIPPLVTDVISRGYTAFSNCLGGTSPIAVWVVHYALKVGPLGYCMTKATVLPIVEPAQLTQTSANLTIHVEQFR